MERTLHRRIWHIAGPAILANMSFPLLGLVDTALLGHLENTRYMGAAAIGSSILAFAYWSFGFIRMGTTGLVARAVGAGDQVRELNALAQSLVLAGGLALLLMATFPWWRPLGLALMAPGPAMEALTASYLGIRIFGTPAEFGMYAIIGWFIGHQNTRWPMVIIVFANLVNLVLDVLFIVVLDWRSDGAAAATLAAEYAGFALAAWAMWRRLDRTHWHDVHPHLLRFASYRELFAINRNLFLRTVLLLFAFAFFTAMGTRLGQDVLAANAIAIQLLLLMAYGLDGFAHAVEGLGGTAAGAADMGGFRAAVRGCAVWSLAIALLFSLGFYLSEPALFSLFTNHDAVLLIAAEHAGWLIVLPLVAAWCYLFDGVFIGATSGRAMMVTMLFSVFVVYLPAWYALQPWGNHGLWCAFLLFHIARSSTLYGYYVYLNRVDGWAAAGRV